MNLNVHKKNYEKIFLIITIIFFFTFNLDKLSYGLPYFWNPDELEFQNSILGTLFFVTDLFDKSYNPLYVSILNAFLILKYIFINELLINSLSLSEIKSKIYFNTEIFIFYGRLASLTITTFSIFFLYLIFKKLKISFIVYSILLITFSSSLVAFNLSTIMGKNSSNLLIYLIQIYFLIKYLIKIQKFSFKSYIYFSILASIAWGVNYWPAFISLYAVTILHYKKYKISKIFYYAIFILIFIIFGPYLNILYVDMTPFDHLSHTDGEQKIEVLSFINSSIARAFTSLKTIFSLDKNCLLLIFSLPFFILNKKINFKKEFWIIFFLSVEPIILFGLTGTLVPQVRYFGGIICVILILVGIIYNNFYKLNFKFFIIIFLILNTYFIYDNFHKINKINKVISKKNTFKIFNDQIKIDKKKILYLVNLNFQENLDNIKYYKNVYRKNLIIKNSISDKFYKNILNKNKIIENSKNIKIINPELKENIIYHNYTLFPIKDFNVFFNTIKNDFDYIVVESSPTSYLSDQILQKKINEYVKDNFQLEYSLFKNNKNFLVYQQSVIHHFSNSLTRHDVNMKNYNRNLEVVYGGNYSIYKINNN